MKISKYVEILTYPTMITNSRQIIYITNITIYYIMFENHLNRHL